MTDRALINKVDTLVRQHAVYVPDSELRDSWTSYAKDVLAGRIFRGDCDDWAQTALEILHRRGVPKRVLYRALVATNGDLIDHMIGLVEVGPGQFVCVGDTFGEPVEVHGNKVRTHTIKRVSRMGEMRKGLPLWRLWGKASFGRETNIAAVGMSISGDGLAFIKSYEKLVLRVYDDKNPGKTLRPGTAVKGILTGGYGHTGSDVTVTTVVTPSKALAWLKADIAVAERAVRKAVRVSLTQSQFDALVSFVFNAGEGNFKTSTLLKKINAQAPVNEIQAQFRRWVYSGGQLMKGLVTRRNAEAAMWAGETATSASPKKTTRIVDIRPDRTVEEDKSVMKSKDVLALGGATGLGSITFISEIRDAVREFNDSVDIGIITSVCGAVLALIGAYLLYKRLREILVEARR